jgi:carboxypeptidase PM20D1
MEFLKNQGIQFAVVLDEGGAVIDRAIDGMDRPYAVVGVTEKGYMDLKITARGTGGHSSTPPRNTPAARLFAFANEIEKKRPFKKKMLPETIKMFSRMAPAFSFGLRMLFGNLWLFYPLVKVLMPRVSPFGEAIMATTCCFTMMQGSEAANMIPTEPYIVANLRTTVFESCEASLAVMQKYAAKHNLEIEVLKKRDASPISNIYSAEYAYVETCIRQQFPGIGVAPYIIMGGTDCRHFHALSENALRFSAVPMSSAQSASCHGIDENIDVEALAEGVSFYKLFLENYKL